MRHEAVRGQGDRRQRASPLALDPALPEPQGEGARRVRKGPANERPASDRRSGVRSHSGGSPLRRRRSLGANQPGLDRGGRLPQPGRAGRPPAGQPARGAERVAGDRGLGHHTPGPRRLHGERDQPEQHVQPQRRHRREPRPERLHQRRWPLRQWLVAGYLQPEPDSDSLLRRWRAERRDLVHPHLLRLGRRCQSACHPGRDAVRRLCHGRLAAVLQPRRRRRKRERVHFGPDCARRLRKRRRRPEALPDLRSAQHRGWKPNDLRGRRHLDRDIHLPEHPGRPLPDGHQMVDRPGRPQLQRAAEQRNPSGCPRRLCL